MRLLVLADIDISHWEWEEGTADVVVACGDVSDDLILEAADAYSCSNIVAVKGNHATVTYRTYKPPYTISEVLRLKAEGLNHSQIAQHFGISRSRVWQLIKAEEERVQSAAKAERLSLFSPASPRSRITPPAASRSD